MGRFSVRARFFEPDSKMRRFCTTIFLIEIDGPENELLEDHLFPEWATLRFFSAVAPGSEARTRSGAVLADTNFPVTGSRAQEVRFRLGPTRQWAVCLTPLGWAAFVGESADRFTDQVVDGHVHPAFERFRLLARTVFQGLPDEEAELARIVAFLNAIDPLPVPDEERLDTLFVAIHDAEMKSVGDLVERSGIGRRTLERTCLRAFGFPPKVLLTRQRFMRSLSQFTLDPSLKWIGAIDSLYHDQAQFVRDFRRFMGMTPSEYAELEKPIVGPVLHERERYTREFVRAVRREGDARNYGV